MKPIKLPIVLVIVLITACLAASCNSGSKPSETVASGAPINTQFNVLAMEQNLKALQDKVGAKAQIVEMMIRPASLEAIVTVNGANERLQVIEGQLQPTLPPASKEEKREAVRLESVKLNEILAAMTQQKAEGQQLSYVKIEKIGATGYFFSAEKPMTVKTDLAGKLQ
ncbi:MAG: hypothetical protein JNM09_00945 [Blastocatellia bacterium]|nr:hypothetical protein [Blastocatellia bacterium]